MIIETYTAGHTTCASGSITDRRVFLHSFVQRITFNHPEVRIEYNLPCIKRKAEPLKTEVLPFVSFSSLARTTSELFSLNGFEKWLREEAGQTQFPVPI